MSDEVEMEGVVIPLVVGDWDRAPVQLHLFERPSMEWVMEMKIKQLSKEPTYKWVLLSDAQRRVSWFSVRRLRTLAEEGKLPGAKKIGDRWFVPEEVVAALETDELRIEYKPRGGNKRQIQVQPKRHAASG